MRIIKANTRTNKAIKKIGERTLLEKKVIPENKYDISFKVLLDKVKSIIPKGIVFINNYNSEVDYFFPDYMFGIKIIKHSLFNQTILDNNGLNGRKYLFNLKNKYLELGINLIFLYEYQIADSTEFNIKTSLIQYKFFKSDKIYARNLVPVILSPRESKEFLDVNHTQKSTAAVYHLGLCDTADGKLYAVMTIGNNRFTKTKSLEIIRYATLQGYAVSGGFSKLLSNFTHTYINEPTEVVSYCNLDYSDGNLYEKNSFELVSSDNSFYFYYLNGKIFNRQIFQKHKLKDKLAEYSDDLTEYENMKLNNYDRIFSAGVSKYIKTLIPHNL